MKKREEQKTRTNNGITLIALVITIIVLLILAGVTIVTLTGENGILTKTTEAKEKTGEANAEEQVKIAVAGSIGTDGKIDNEELEKNLNQIENISGVPSPITDASYPITVTVDGYQVTINKDGSVTVGDNAGGGDTGETVVDGVKIPEGFYHVEGTTVTGGLVISDEKDDDLSNLKGGNQYVWIPVDGILGEEGKTVQNAVEGEIILGRYVFDSNGDIDTTLTPTTLGGELKTSSTISYNYTESSTGNGNTVAKDIEGFIQSVRQNGGYYIARFEASQNTETNKAESKYDKTVWNSINQPNAAIACQDLYAGVNSDLMNSYAWDTAILFIQKYGQSNYSRQDGNSINSSLQNTGKSGDVQLNVYDMAGNCYEWTTETSSRSSYPCVDRGGGYNTSIYYTSYRYGYSTSGSFTNFSFRPLLYL